MKVIKVAMLGMGNVNQNLLKLLINKQDCLMDEYGMTFQIVAATDSSGIVVVNNEAVISRTGLDIMTLLVNHKQAGKSLSELKLLNNNDNDDFFFFGGSSSSSGNKSVQQILQELELDLIFEATPCCVGDPTKTLTTTTNSSDGDSTSEALTIIREALIRGVSVVLANKGPLVHAIGELLDLEQSNITTNGRQQGGPPRGRLAYSATVCGGLPILNIGQRDMIAGTITKLHGVFNATSNFILDALAKGMSFQDAITEAQNVGAAEADPSLDTDGWDTAFKLLIIVNTFLRRRRRRKSGDGSTPSDDDDNKKPLISLSDISVQGIQDITPERIQMEEAKGNVIKLVATADEESGTFSVRPLSQPVNSFLGSITGWEMGVEIHSDIYGISYHKLYEKEPIPTAASMMRDAVNIFQ